MKNLISIGYQIPGHSEIFKHFSDPVSLLDYDIVIIAPIMNYEYYEYHDGKPRYSDSSSFQVKEDSQHWSREIQYSLNAGKTVFLILSEKEDFFVYSGRKEFTETGRNARHVNYVEHFDNYQFLSFASVRVQSTNGKLVDKPRSSIFSIFFSEFKEYLSYKNYLEIAKADPVFLTKTGDKLVGAMIKNSNGGHLVLLPYIEYDWEKFTLKNKKGESVWNKEAIAWGNKFSHCLIEIDKSLSSRNESTPAPQWILNQSFVLEAEKAILSKIESIESNVSKLNQELGYCRQELDKARELKDLLYETGKNLERAVEKALHILGYKAENFDDGVLELDHVIISPEGLRYIGECEGKDNSSVDISKFRQLADEIHEDFERPEISSEAFGLLFGNPQRLLPLEKRNQAFTQKCIAGAKRKSYGLIITSDLFRICKYILETSDQSFAQKCRNSIHSQLGGIIKFPEIPNNQEEGAS